MVAQLVGGERNGRSEKGLDIIIIIVYKFTSQTN